LIALTLASYLALKKRSRRGLFILMIFSLAYFGFWRQGCVCPIGAIQSVSEALFNHNYAIPVTVLAFFLLPLIFTLFFGRSFCAAVCPLGAVQDIVLIHPLSVPRPLEQVLGLPAYLYFGLAVLFAATGSAYIICQYDPFVAIFRMNIVPHRNHLDILILGGSFIVIGMFVGRPYCRFLCPYGVLLRTFSRVSKWHVTITPDQCVQCRLCENSCPFGAIEKPSPPLSSSSIFYTSDKKRLAFLLVLLPFLIIAGGFLGSLSGEPLSHMHDRIRLAERINLEESGQVPDTTDASDAFRASGQTITELNKEAYLLVNHFVLGGWFLGGFMGLVIGGKLIRLTINQTRKDYLANRSQCLACGRCFSYCPMEQERLKQLSDNQPDEQKPYESKKTSL